MQRERERETQRVVVRMAKDPATASRRRNLQPARERPVIAENSSVGAKVKI